MTGYEIHMGQSIYETQPCRLVELTDTRTQEANTDGYASDRYTEAMYMEFLTGMKS